MRQATLLTSSFGRIVHVCPHCQTGTLERQEIIDARNDDTEVAWVCGNAPLCLFHTEDYQNAPLARFDCGRCSRPLKLIRTRLRSVWRCTGWFAASNECRATYPDQSGEAVRGRWGANVVLPVNCHASRRE